MAVFQQIKVTIDDVLDKAIKYYSLLFVLNDLKITQKEIQLIAFMAVKGTIAPKSAREEFVTKFKTSLAHLENVKGMLYKKRLIVKVDEKYRVHPKISLDFTQPLIIRLEFIQKPETNATIHKEGQAEGSTPTENVQKD